MLIRRRPRVVCCLLAALWAACGSPEKPLRQRPPVLLVSLDTVRADVLGALGEDGETVTPNLDRLAADSRRYTRALSEIPFTLPAHVSMLTGTAPEVHGVLDDARTLGPGLTTLAETLSAAGYATAAVVSSDWLRPEFGFSRGFEHYLEVPLALDFSSRVNERALDLVDRLAGEPRPLFLLLHYYDAHSDFASEGNRRPYWAPDRWSRTLPEECRRGLCAPSGECATDYLLWANRHPRQVAGVARDCLEASYRAGVRALDERIGELVAGLRARGLYRRALIVVTSDHGEEFGEHGQFVHAQTHDESIAVPLLLKLPGGRLAGSEDRRPVQLADVVPTILSLLGIATPPFVSGTSLLDEGAPRPPALAQNKHRPERYALVSGRWKLIHDYVTGRSRLFDLEADPMESSDLAVAEPAEVERLRRLLEERIRELRQHRGPRIGPETEAGSRLAPEAKRRLEALGYVD